MAQRQAKLTELRQRDAAQRIVQTATEVQDQKLGSAPDELALRESEARYKLVFESVKEVIYQIDVTGHWLLLNPAWEEISGFSVVESIGKNLLDHVHPDDHARSLELFNTNAEWETDHQRRQIRFIKKSGGFCWVEVLGRRMRDDSGSVIGITGILNDITDRIDLEASQRHAASVFLHAHDGIMICDGESRILEVNPAFSLLTGYARHEVIGETPRILRSGEQTPAFYHSLWQSIREYGFWEGEIWNRRKNGEIYPEWLSISSITDANGAVSRYIGVFSDISAIKLQHKKLERLAHFDPLTQLPNRVLLADRMKQSIAHAKRAGKLLGICYLDLDGFKPVNDRFGHDAGDHVLTEIAKRLKATIRGSDSVARLGGDEFVVLVTDIDSVLECQRAIARILAAISAPLRVKDQAVTLGASIGVTIFPLDGSDPDTLLRHADQAMYTAKQAGRNRYHMFETQHDKTARSQLAGLDEIREGLLRGEFLLLYQPKVNMRLGDVLGFEALIRWQHPELGLLLPIEFLPRIESTDVELALGRWVIAEGFRQLNEWRSAGQEYTLSLNISAPHLLMPGFLDELTGLLERYDQIERRDIELEILETVALEDLGKASMVFSRCRELGVQIALDDFGTGYSSLSYLRRLPVDTLKIDQSFVRSMLDNEEDLVIVQSVVGLSKAFHRNVIAEGIETPELGALLMKLGCDVGQGFGIARPMPAAAVPDWLSGFRSAALWPDECKPATVADLPLLSAEIEHTSWVEQLKRWLQAEADELADLELPLMDSRMCKLGRWQSGEGRNRYANCDAFPSVKELHERAHRIGNELVTLRLAGGIVEARQRIGELIRIDAALVEQMHSLQDEIQLHETHLQSALVGRGQMSPRQDFAGI